MRDFLNKELFNIEGYAFEVHTLITFIVFMAVVMGVLSLLKRIIYSSKKLNTGEKFSINKISRYLIILIAFLVGLRIVGFDITVFLAGYAALLVGIGFGLQNIFSDFISGIILLLDGSLKVDDIVEVNGKIYIVEEIKFRTTTVLGRDENYVILPNSELTTNSVVNWTYNKRPSRFHIDLGVDYSRVDGDTERGSKINPSCSGNTRAFCSVYGLWRIVASIWCLFLHTRYLQSRTYQEHNEGRDIQRIDIQRYHLSVSTKSGTFQERSK